MPSIANLPATTITTATQVCPATYVTFGTRRGRMRKNLCVFGLALFTLLSALSFAAETLLIGPGDTLHVQVLDTPELDQHPRVTDSGEIPLIGVGDLNVAGLTPAV